jgi:hypothetical protein
MGLDWTAALLPSDRPSWCSAAHHPQSPPNAFALPAPTSLFLPNPGGTGRIKRTGTWRWEEPEWRVLVKKAGGSGTSRVERALPALKEAVDPSAGRLAMLASKMKELNPKLGEGSSTSSHPDEPTAHEEEEGREGGGEGDGEPTTDADGWVYGDNKWEATTDKGGLGKVIFFHLLTDISQYLITHPSTVHPV